MNLGNIHKGQTIKGRFLAKNRPILTEIWIVRDDDVFKPSTDGISLQKKSLGIKDLYQIKIDTSIDVNSGGFWKKGSDYDVILAPDILFTFSCENRYARGTDNANTVIPDRAGTCPTVEAIRQELDTNSTKLDCKISSRSPIGEYDKELDCKLSSRSQSGEYKHLLDRKLSDLSPKGEYDTQLDGKLSDLSKAGEYSNTLKANFATLTELAGELIELANTVTGKLPVDRIFGTEHLETLVDIHRYIQSMSTEWCPAVVQKIERAYDTGVKLSADQPNYQPAKAGDEMNLTDSPNPKAIDEFRKLFRQQFLFDPKGNPPVSPTHEEGLSWLYALLIRLERRESAREIVWCNNLGKPSFGKKKSKDRNHDITGKCQQWLT